MQLTTMDVHQLIKNPSSVSKNILAESVVKAFASGSFNPSEAVIASDIFRLLLKDTEKSVRSVLSEHLYNNASAPHDVIFSLACDEEDIAGRVLQYSPVLNDEDLIDIIKSSKSILSLCAIARREKVSSYLSDALIDTRQEKILSDLFNNKNAEITGDSLIKAWGMIATNESLLEILVRRGGLPITIAEKMLAVVADELKYQLMQEYNLSGTIATNAAIDAREWGLLGLLPVEKIGHPDHDERVEDLVTQLYESGRLTPSLAVRALCMGFLNLFEAIMARMANVPRANARILIMGGSEGFHALYKAAGMPEGFMDAVGVVLAISLRLTKYNYEKPVDFRKQLIENIYVKGYHRAVDGMSYLLSIIDGKISNNQYSSTAVH